MEENNFSEERISEISEISETLQEFDKKDQELLNKLEYGKVSMKLKPAPSNVFLINKEKKSIVFIEPEIKDNLNYLVPLSQIINLLIQENPKTEINFISLAEFLPMNILLFLNMINERNPVILFLKNSEYQLFQDDENAKSFFNGTVQTIDEAVKQNLIKIKN